MQVLGPLQAPLLQRPQRRPRPVEKPQERAAEAAPVELIRLVPEGDYISGEEALAFDERELSQHARRALKGYWTVAHQAHPWTVVHRVDLYI